MGVLQKQNKKNLFWLTATSVVTSIFFSLAGAPFLRTLFASVSSKVFWTIALAVVGGLFLVGHENYRVSETAVYVGAIWMTLGIYSEFEKRGINWRLAGVFSLLSGLIFSVAGYFIVLKSFENTMTPTEIVQSVKDALLKAFPNINTSGFNLVYLIPGMLVMSLFFTLCMGVAFESKAARMFQIKRERVASGLRWLEFRLPDSSIWLVLVSALIFAQTIVEVDANIIRFASNILLVFAGFYLVQGAVIVEFVLRYYRVGLFTRTITYLLIFLQLGPLLMVLGFVDYWADFRRLMRRKKKQNI